MVKLAERVGNSGMACRSLTEGKYWNYGSVLALGASAPCVEVRNWGGR